MDIFTVRNRVVIVFMEETERIAPNIKPEVVKYVRSQVDKQDQLFREKAQIDRQQNPDIYETWEQKYHEWRVEINAQASKLQFG